MADDDVVDFASTCRAHVPAAGDTVILSRPHRTGKVGEFRAVHGRAGMGILCTGQGGGPVPEAKRLLHMRRRPMGGTARRGFAGRGAALCLVVRSVRRRLVHIQNYGP